MIQSRRQSTHKQYQTYIVAWHVFCATTGVSPTSPTIPQVIDYLEHIRTTRSLGYSALNTARSALSSILPLINAIPIGQHPLVKTYLRGAYNINPPAPRYSETWDPEQLLRLLKQWSPPDTLSLQMLTFKLLALVLLVTGQRIQTVSLLDLDFLFLNDSRAIFQIPGLLKQSRPGYTNPTVVLSAYPNDNALCVLTVLLEYIRRTEGLRSAARALFVSFRKPHGPVTKQTLARWMKSTMDMAHIDTSIYAPHSVRSASTSAALRGGVPVQHILDKAGWASRSVFARFYNRPTTSTNHFESAVLARM